LQEKNVIEPDQISNSFKPFPATGQGVLPNVEMKQEVLERTNLPTFLTLFNNAV
jgi:hypothetical protein